MPMTTMFVGRAPRCCWTRRTCSAISAVVRLRRSPRTPDAQNTRYLYPLLASHEFQEGLKNYRDLRNIDPALEQKQIDRLAAVKAGRDSSKVAAALAALKGGAAKGGVTLMPLIIEASRDYVTLGEMCDALREVWGVWRETPVF